MVLQKTKKLFRQAMLKRKEKILQWFTPKQY